MPHKGVFFDGRIADFKESREGVVQFGIFRNVDL